jgi:hypothetical protein
MTIREQIARIREDIDLLESLADRIAYDGIGMIVGEMNKRIEVIQSTCPHVWQKEKTTMRSTRFDVVARAICKMEYAKSRCLECGKRDYSQETVSMKPVDK